MRNIKEEMMKVKGGEFPEWYNSLTKEEIKLYKKELAKLQIKK